MRYTIEELRSYRLQYTDPIFPGFSLEALLDCRKEFGTTHKRGENAYTIRVAKTEREKYARIVRRELNKLTESNYDAVLESLKDPLLLLIAEYRSVLVEIIHQKALLEPECSHNYAAMCRDLADYETRCNKKEKEKPRSLFRTDLVMKVREEFERTLEEPTGAQAEAAYGVKPENSAELNAILMEEGRTAHLRRKLANIRFIGQLYLHDVFTTTTMGTVLGQILKDSPQSKPRADNVEAVVVLLTTIGLRLSMEKAKMAQHSLAQLNQINNGYPTRIKYMIMDLCDLQKNGWRKREDRQPSSPTVEKSGGRGRQSGGGGGGYMGPSFSSPSLKHQSGSSNRFGEGPSSPSSSSMTWRDAAAITNSRKDGSGHKGTGVHGSKMSLSKQAAGASKSKKASGKTESDGPTKGQSSSFAKVTHTATLHAEEEEEDDDDEEEEDDEEDQGKTTPSTDSHDRTIHSTSSSSFAPPPKMPPQQGLSKLSFRTLVRTSLADWVERLENDYIAHWAEPFSHCDRSFNSIPELGEAVAAEVVSHACMTTRVSSQEEAAGFCSVALDLSDAEILGGFSTALAKAIEESVLEDCPKFSERWMRMLGLISDSLTDLYFDLGSICREAYQHKLAGGVGSGGGGGGGTHAPARQEHATGEGGGSGGSSGSGGTQGEGWNSGTTGEKAEKESDADEGGEDFIEDELAQVMDTMRSFWGHLQKPAEEERMDVRAVMALIDNTSGTPRDGLDKVLAAYLYHLHSLDVFPEGSLEILQQYESTSQPVLFKQVVEELHRAIYSAV